MSNIIVKKNEVSGRTLYLYGLLVHFIASSAQLLQGTVGILPMNHNNVGTASGRNHLLQDIPMRKYGHHIEEQRDISHQSHNPPHPSPQSGQRSIAGDEIPGKLAKYIWSQRHLLRSLQSPKLYDTRLF